MNSLNLLTHFWLLAQAPGVLANPVDPLVSMLLPFAATAVALYFLLVKPKRRNKAHDDSVTSRPMAELRTTLSSELRGSNVWIVGNLATWVVMMFVDYGWKDVMPWMVGFSILAIWDAQNIKRLLSLLDVMEREDNLTRRPDPDVRPIPDAKQVP